MKMCYKKHFCLLMPVVTLALICFTSISPQHLSASESSQTPATVSFTLHDAILHALAHNPLVERTQLNRKQAQLFIDEVKAQTILPEFSLSGEFGVVPEARGDVFQSQDKQTDLDGWGPFIKINLKMLQPLLTFGRTKSALTAARSAVILQNIKSNSEIQELTLETIKAYWAVSASRQAETIASEVQENYDKLENEVQQRLDSENSEVDDTDLLEVKSNRYQIQEIVIKSQNESRLAEKALNFALGRDLMQPISVTGAPIPTINLDETQLDQAVQHTLNQHHDAESLKTAIEALDAKAKITLSKKRPLVYIAGGLEYAWAPHREDQTNPFAVDNFNYRNLGAFFGFRWDLNSLRKNHEAQRYLLEKQAMEQNLVLLRSKIRLEILKAFSDVRQNTLLLEQAQNSLKSAKSWLRLSMDNWEMGLGDVERLIKAYNSYYVLKGIVIKRELELQISLADFAYILGNINLYMEWIKNGKVILF